MNEENKNKIIINNYFFIPYEYLKEFNPKQVFYPLGKTNEIDLTQNNFLNKKREKTDIIIIKQEKESEKNDIDIDKKNDENKTLIKKDDNSTIEINKKIKFSTKKIYFAINNNKKVGRKPKSSVINGYHTKFSHDNILRKIKGKFFKKLIKYINNLILFKYKNKMKLLKPLISSIAQNNTKSFNRDLLNKKLKDVFSSYKMNGKFKLCDENHNKIVIKNIYDDNITELIDILEMTLLEIFVIFRDSNEERKLNGLERLNKVIEELKFKESDEYMNKFKKVAMNFENYYFIKNNK